MTPEQARQILEHQCAVHDHPVVKRIEAMNLNTVIEMPWTCGDCHTRWKVAICGDQSSGVGNPTWRTRRLERRARRALGI